jgi:Zn-dependent protease
LEAEEMDSLDRILAYDLDQLPFVFIALAIAFAVHEYAHAAVAYWFGDDTAKRAGRVTLNPIVHLDLVGTILVLFAGFGWAKPVPVNRQNFQNPRLMGALVSVAGPLSNLLLCTLGIFVYILLQKFGVIAGADTGVAMAIMTFFTIYINLNLILFLFNLIPLPPLDGYRIIEDLVPPNIANVMQRYETYGYAILFLMFLLPQVSQPILGPLYDFGGRLTDHIYQFFYMVL